VQCAATIEQAQDDEVDGALEAIVRMLRRRLSRSQLGEMVAGADRRVK
jgi:hypothetical protein